MLQETQGVSEILISFPLPIPKYPVMESVGHVAVIFSSFLRTSMLARKGREEGDRARLGDRCNTQFEGGWSSDVMQQSKATAAYNTSVFSKEPEGRFCKFPTQGMTALRR